MKRPASLNAIDYSQLAFPKGNCRLAGKDLQALRRDCLKRDKNKCRECGMAVSDSFPAWHPKKAHMAHVRSRGAGGADDLSNVRVLCGDCHRAEHGNPTNGT